MAEFSIARLREEFSYDPETGVITRFKRAQKSGMPPGSPVMHTDQRGYIAVCLDRRKMKGHRVAWAMHYGEWPSRPLDHINGAKTDNRISNLRLADASQNGANTPARARNRTGLKGVSPHKGRYRAQISVRGKYMSLGCYDTKEAAGEAYEKAALEHFGEYSSLARRKKKKGTAA